MEYKKQVIKSKLSVTVNSLISCKENCASGQRVFCYIEHGLIDIKTAALMKIKEMTYMWTGTAG